MRKAALLGSTALAVGVVTCWSSDALAQFTVTVGGFSEVQWGYVDSDRDLEVEQDFRNDTEIHVSARAKAENGLAYGVLTQIEFGGGSTNTAFDETRLFVSGTFGEVWFGDDDGAGDVLSVFAPTVGIGQLDGAAGDFSDLGEVGGLSVKAPDSSDSTKIAYFTPTFSGFQAGVSYAAQANGGDNSSTLRSEFESTAYRNWIEFGANYRTAISGFGVIVGGSGTVADGTDAGGIDRDSLFAWQFGAQVSIAGFTVGGGYVNGDDFVTTYNGVNVEFENSWNVGAAYTNGPISVAANYAQVEFDEADADIFSAGGQYQLAPGLLLRADYYYISADIDDAADDIDGDENIFVVGVRVNF